MEKIYAVLECKDRYEYYNETIIFVSKDKEKVEKWVNKYNRIVKDNKERIFAHHQKICDNDYRGTDCYKNDIFVYSHPLRAEMIEIEVR